MDRRAEWWITDDCAVIHFAAADELDNRRPLIPSRGPLIVTRPDKFLITIKACNLQGGKLKPRNRQRALFPIVGSGH